MIYPPGMNQPICAILTSLLLLAACGDDDDATPENPVEEAVAAAEETLGEEIEEVEEGEEPDPCALLTESVIRTTFEVPEDTPVEQQPSIQQIRPMCTYSWDKPDAEEIRARVKQIQQERVQEMFRKMRRGKQAQAITDLAMDLPSESNRVSLNFSPPPRTAARARAMFFAAMATLEGGVRHTIEVEEGTEGVSERVRQEVDGQEIEFQADLEEVEGIGDEARWIPRLNQLAVLNGDQILYLTVEMDVDRSVNRDEAKTLMAALLD